jgi:uncharacterized membrane protein YccF (DUF307 family)
MCPRSSLVEVSRDGINISQEGFIEMNTVVNPSSNAAASLSPSGNSLSPSTDTALANVAPPVTAPSPVGVASPPAAPFVSSPTTQSTELHNTVNVNVAMPSIQMNMMHKGHSLITRIFWFCFVGWWLSAIFIMLGVIFTWTVVLMPIGFWFINRIPKAQTLRERTRQFKTEFSDNAIVFTEGNRGQHPWYLRAPYALTVGAVAGLVWLSTAWLLGILIVTLPLSIWMIDRAPAVMTLEKN